MTNFDKLLNYSETNCCGLFIEYDPGKQENWSIKLYQDPDDEAYFFANDSTLEKASSRILHEMEQADA